MKMTLPLFTGILLLFSCTHSEKKNDMVQEKTLPQKQHFFPVSSYLKGELYTIKNKGINPLKYTTINNHTDSVWLKIEDLDAAVQEFLQPEIDSVNLITLFTEKSFLDQTLNAITLTYDPAVPLPDTFKLKHWDVYIDPDLNTVKRIYMVKEMSKTSLLQLTWVNNRWCKITYIVTDEKGVSTIEKEEKLVWDF